MKLKELQLADEEIRLLAGARETALGQVMLKVLEARREMHSEDLDMNPRITGQVTKDMRHITGICRGLRFLDRVVTAAKAHVSGQSGVSIP